MQLKLNKDELLHLVDILEKSIDHSKEISEMMMEALLVEVYQKLAQKALFAKEKNSFKLTLAQCVALLLNFASYNNNDDYQMNLVRIIIANIHQYVTSIHRLNKANRELPF